MAVPPSSSRTSSSPLPSPPHFAPIQEEETEQEPEPEPEPEPEQSTAATYHHRPTPLRHPTKSSRREDLSVSCSKCRPSSRDKITVVPLDTNGQKRPSSVPGSTPNSLLRSLFSALARKTPPHATSTPFSSSEAQDNGDWKLTAANLSRKLLQVTRKRDDALVEASRLKHSVSELERKLNRLESYCRDLQASLDRRATTGPTSAIVEQFLLAVNDARTAVRHLSRCLITQLRAAPRSMDRLGSLLHSHGLVKKNPGSLIMGLESVLNRVFYSDFERVGEGEGMLADPADRCKANWAAYEAIRGLCWEDVLSKGTRHYSAGLSRFCDRRMSEVVGMLGWARAWPEGLLQAFFGAARGVWAVHLLARSVHPALTILRVDRGARFDPVYMEDSTGEKPTTGEVIMMVGPGFYVNCATCSVVKCRVLIVSGEKSERNDGGQKIERV